MKGSYVFTFHVIFDVLKKSKQMMTAIHPEEYIIEIVSI